MRVYDVNPVLCGERQGRGEVYARVSTGEWRKVPMVTRVEFKSDADEGEAVITAIIADEAGRPVLNDSRTEALRFTFNAFARYTPFADEAVSPDAIVQG